MDSLSFLPELGLGHANQAVTEVGGEGGPLCDGLLVCMAKAFEDLAGLLHSLLEGFQESAVVVLSPLAPCG